VGASPLSLVSHVYLITFRCYGTMLPGEAGSVDDETNVFGSRYRPSSTPLARSSLLSMRDQPYSLSPKSRQLVLESIIEVCSRRQWQLLAAAHVRTNHIHVVLEAEATPEKVMSDLKVYASCSLNRVEGKRTRWARHGSTRYLWTKEQIDRAVIYVINEQGHWYV
jgi:REP element-mobilizing transposase RayT